MKKLNLLLAILFLAINTGCVTVSKNVDKLNLSAKVLQNPRLAFFQIKNSFMHDCEVTDNTEQPIECKYDAAIASGTLINSTVRGFHILTAAHICKIQDMEVITQQLSVIDLQKKEYSVKVVAIDTKKDMCILFAEAITQIEPISMSEQGPTPADVVYNVAAPHGIVLKDFVPMFDGRFIGTQEENAWYVLYAAPGSSGSMILNHRGQLIGILTHTINDMPIARSPLYKDLFNFVQANKNNIKSLDVYSNK